MTGPATASGPITASGPVTAFRTGNPTDDELAALDGTATAVAVRTGQLSRREVVESALRRARHVDPELALVEVWDDERALASTCSPVPGPFSGVPTFVKDNTDVTGLPTGHGSEAFVARPARRDAPVTRVLRRLGLVVLGKSRMPEFGFNATTEYRTRPPARNPWDPSRSPGASSGGSAGLVAAGVVPLAHANDGGGSIRIPAAACGLVGLKPTRGRYPAGPPQRVLPVDIVAEGVLTRTVRDTAQVLASAERRGGRRGLPPVGLVEGPAPRRLRIGVVLDSVTGSPTDTEVRGAVTTTAELLGALGHVVVETVPPVGVRFVDDFELYWSMLGFLMTSLGPRLFPGFDRRRLDPLTQGLDQHFRAHRRHLPGAVRRLRASRDAYAQALTGFDAVLTPVVAGVTPRVGDLGPQHPFEQLFARLVEHVAFTPVNNAAGSPAIALPLAVGRDGLPIGMHLMGRHGDERTLLELAFELEAAVPFRRAGGDGTARDR